VQLVAIICNANNIQTIIITAEIYISPEPTRTADILSGFDLYSVLPIIWPKGGEEVCG
jgi:hypothetical protein